MPVIQLFIIFFITISVLGQTKETPLDSVPKEAIDRITNEAGLYFKQALFEIRDNRLKEARHYFDKTIEVFLMSTINVRRNGKLNLCYNQIIETIYRMEIRTNFQPNINGLTATCGWVIDSQLVFDVLKLFPYNNKEKSESGFVEQKFVPSPNDELAQLDLGTDSYLKTFVGLNQDEKNSAKYKNCQTLQSPTIRNIRLGMTLSEASQALKTKITLEKSTLSVVGLNFGRVGKVSGVFQLFLHFLDGRISWIKVQYDKSIRWNGQSEFTRRVSESLLLPNLWTFNEVKNESYLACQNFEIKVTGLYDNTFIIETFSNKSIELISRRIREKNLKEQQIEQKKKETFKP